MTRMTRGVATQCSKCSTNNAKIRTLIFGIERRVRRGLDPLQTDLDKIAETKQWLRACAENGHHDPQAGPATRWANR